LTSHRRHASSAWPTPRSERDWRRHDLHLRVLVVRRQLAQDGREGGGRARHRRRGTEAAGRRRTEDQLLLEWDRKQAGAEQIRAGQTVCRHSQSRLTSNAQTNWPLESQESINQTRKRWRWVNTENSEFAHLNRGLLCIHTVISSLLERRSGCWLAVFPLGRQANKFSLAQLSNIHYLLCRQESDSK
jgi:hypothetical protein